MEMVPRFFILERSWEEVVSTFLHSDVYVWFCNLLSEQEEIRVDSDFFKLGMFSFDINSHSLEMLKSLNPKKMEEDDIIEKGKIWGNVNFELQIVVIANRPWTEEEKEFIFELQEERLSGIPQSVQYC